VAKTVRQTLRPRGGADRTVLGRNLVAMPVREVLPRFLPPMLARNGPLPDRGDTGWVSEVKWDGIRAQLRIDRGSLTFAHPPGRNPTSEFPELAALGERLRTRRLLLDGELVCLDAEGRPDFAAVIARMGVANDRGGRPALLQLLDVLHPDGEPVRGLPYQQRRELLTQIRELLPTDLERVQRTFTSDEDLPRVTFAMGLEGVIANAGISPTGRADATVAGSTSSTTAANRSRSSAGASVPEPPRAARRRPRRTPPQLVRIRPSRETVRELGRPPAATDASAEARGAHASHARRRRPQRTTRRMTPTQP